MRNYVLNTIFKAIVSCNITSLNLSNKYQTSKMDYAAKFAVIAQKGMDFYVYPEQFCCLELYLRMCL